MDRKPLIVVIVWIVLLGGFLLYASWPTITKGSTEVVLRLQPVDPDDILKGDYLTLRYEISNIPNIPTEEYSYGDPIYVTLVPSGEVWVMSGYSRTRPSSGVFIKGQYVSYWNTDVEYGIEQFFIPEGSGDDIRLDSSYTARVVLDPTGSARVVEILKDGRPIEFNYKRKER
jgi:uncharacterized membrane-anchored protein